MQASNQEIYIIILIGIVLALMLVGFMVTIFLLYQRKRMRQDQDLIQMKDQYERELLRAQLEIQEQTTKGIAQELHDNVGQVLSVVKLWLGSLPVEKDHPAYSGLNDSRQMLNRVIYDMSDLTKSLHTDRITEIGLLEAIRFDLDSLKKTGLMEFNLSVSGEEFSFDGQKSIFLFRIYQEMTNNILKHSGAKTVNISVVYSDHDKFVLKVEDDGIGFDLEKKKQGGNASSGLGLKNIINRGKLIGADVSIESQPGKGTTIVVEMGVTR
ncbi:MAG: sensor histidine kinase [Chitinophagales bacterium]